MEKLYVVTRRDLPEGAQATQMTHAAIAFVLHHVDLARRWHDGANNLVELSVPDLDDLESLWSRVHDELGVAAMAFREPDLGDALTAIAFAGTTESIRLVSSLPLALRQRQAA